MIDDDDYDYDDDNDHDDDDDQVRSLAEWQEKKLSDLLCKPGPRIVLCRSLSFSSLITLFQ